MIRIIYKNDEMDRLTIDESIIVGFRWYKGCDDHLTNLMFEIDWKGQEDVARNIDLSGVTTRLHCMMVHDAKFHFDFMEPYTIGALEITTFEFCKKGKTYALRFNFDFSPVGFIELKCIDFYFEIIEK